MWGYRHTDELYHYGVMGMKWGHRKQYKQALATAKRNYRDRDARIQERYDKEEANIESGYRRGQMLSKKDQAREHAADARAMRDWAKSKATYKAEKARLKNQYKENVAKSKAEYKSNYRDLKETDTMADKLLYNTATRKAAAHYMTKNKMSMEDARKKAKKEAWRNTAILAIAAIGSVGIEYAKAKANFSG